MKRTLSWSLRLLVVGLLLESVLQGGAFIAWMNRAEPMPQVPAIAGRTVLCVGDSFTFGMGTTSGEMSYPRQLERVLEQRDGQDWVVHSRAVSGRNSREVLERLGGQLEDLTPDLVCILIGLNDRWSRPEMLEVGALDGATPPLVASSREPFRWRFRLARAAAWIGERLTRVPETPEQRPGEIVTTPKTASDTGSAHAPAQAVVTPEPVTPDPEVALGSEPISPLDALRLRADTEGDEGAVTALSYALTEAGHGHECLVRATAAVERFPDNPHLWRHVAWQSFQEGDDERAQLASRRTIDLVEPDDETRKWALFEHSLIFLGVDPVAAVEGMVQTYLVDRDRATFNALVTYREGYLKVEMLDEAMHRLALPEPEREHLRERFLSAVNWAGSDMHTIYAAHLTQLVELSRRAGARPLLISYPGRIDYVEQTMDEVGERLSVTRLPMAVAFEARIAGQDRALHFVPDGHCSDLGYGVMAEIVADSILEAPAPTVPTRASMTGDPP